MFKLLLVVVGLMVIILIAKTVLDVLIIMHGGQCEASVLPYCH